MSTLKGKVNGSMALKGMVSLKEKTKKKTCSSILLVREAGLKYLNEGDELTFEVESTEKDPSR